MEHSFWNTNLFQTITMIASVLTTIGIALCKYHNHKKKELKNATTILLLQIDNIERNIEYIMSEGIINGVLQEAPMHYSTIIYDENQWNKYSHLIVGVITQENYEKIDTFFKVAYRIREQQIYIKQKIQQSIDSKVWHYYNAVYTQVGNNDNPIQNIKTIHQRYNNTSVPSFIQLEFAIGLEKALKQYYRLSDGNAYKELKKFK
ncbi:MAG: hypothetical protein IJA09_06615 [Bacteroidales bacterium]|nr:hypothetical protein [Bacteroidales bacterium]